MRFHGVARLAHGLLLVRVEAASATGDAVVANCFAPTADHHSRPSRTPERLARPPADHHFARRWTVCAEEWHAGPGTRASARCARIERRVEEDLMAGERTGGNTGGIGLGGVLVIVGVVLMIVWSFWIGLIITLVGLIAFGGFAKGKWY